MAKIKKEKRSRKPTTDEHVLDVLGARIRKIYATIRERWLGARGKVSNPAYLRPDNPAWRKAAAFAIKHQIRDLEGHVRSIFAMHQNTEICPHPRQLYGPVALRSLTSANTLSEAGCKSLESELQTMRYTFVSNTARAQLLYPGLPYLQLLECVLLDKAAILTPLFRYCVAAQYNLLRVMELYFSDAFDSYRSFPVVYDRAWGDFIPHQFKVAAGRGGSDGSPE